MRLLHLFVPLVLAGVAAVDLAAASLASARPGNFFRPGEAPAFVLDMGDVPVSGRMVDVVLLDFERRVLATLKLTPAVASGPTIEIAFPPPRTGFYRIEVRGAADALLTATTLGVLPARTPASPDASSRFGTIAHLKRLDDAQRDRMLDLIARAGIGWIREGFLWHELEPSPGDWRTARYDDLVERALDHGVSVLPVLGFGNGWAVRSPTVEGAGSTARQMPPRLDAWEDYVRRMLARYGDRLHAWEIWNEPNLPTFWKPDPDAGEYARVAARAYAAIKETSPADLVITAGFSPEKANRPDLAGHDEGRFLRALEAVEPRPFDIIGYHPYTLFRHGVSPARTETLFRDNFDNLLAGLAGSVRAVPPIWITEVGVSTIPRVTTEDEAAGHLAVLLTLASARADVSKIFLYNFRDVGTDPKEKEDMFGLLHHDYSPKPGYFAYRAFIGTAGRGAFVKRTERDGVIGHEFALPGGRTLLALWSAQADRLTTELAMPAPRAKRINVVGDVTEIPVVDGRLRLEVSGIPIYVEYGQD